jgi:hypothetical protein
MTKVWNTLNPDARRSHVKAMMTSSLRPKRTKGWLQRSEGHFP